MARIDLEADYLVITPRGRWKVLGFRRRMRIPLWTVAKAFRSTRPEMGRAAGRRWPGTAAMGGIAGLMKGPSGRSWWLYRYGAPALVVEMNGGELSFVVVDVDDPEAAAATIEAAAHRRNSEPA
ncbi:hypothetical protein AX769_03465 [Frondihabitans sp. PAMC 28766]|uniref:hypothetical protein n=1 Tax=Frondihabitans sp. PAMC 28766 TaxID=1795630 RepID=UPI00078EF27B|nr:hypothetical protein [Frondihabitans sp. PAMC 28766]AMM19363.1 hypothetical protein AX769_03465 [Frondihabitans sp. PAMC 28766]